MSHLEGDLYVIRPTPGICTGCGHLADVRPVGKKSANLCFDCARKDPKAMRKIDRMIAGSRAVIVDMTPKGGERN